MQQHIPAWKRIGLKLKYAKDSIDPPDQNAEPEINRTSNGNHELSETTNLDYSRPPKKRKLSFDAAGRQPAEVTKTAQTRPSNLDAGDNSGNVNNAEEMIVEQPGWKDTSKEEHNQDLSAATISRPVEESRRKSVTFTPETKQEDGFSASNSDKSWFQSQSSNQSQPDSPRSKSTPIQSQEKPKRSKAKRIEVNEDADSSNSNVDTIIASPNDENEASATNTDGPRSTSKAHQAGQAHEVKGLNTTKAKDKSNEVKGDPSSIEYLRQFSQDRAAWKFNKKKQTTLLKNLFDLHLIPPQHNQVIREYISGLQGEAARQRLIEIATTILHSIAEKQDDFDMQSMESEEARRRAYADALKKEIMRYERSNVEPNDTDEQPLVDMKREIEHGQRAEAVLFTLLDKELYPEKHAQLKATSRQPILTPNRNANSKREASVSTTKSSQAAGVKRIIATEGTDATGLKRKKRKTRTASTNDASSSSSSDSDSDNDNDNDNTPATDGPRSVREALTTTTSAFDSPASSKKSSMPSAIGKGKKTFFDDDLLDKKFPQEKTYHEVAPKRRAGKKQKARGFHYTHGARADESGSESE